MIRIVDRVLVVSQKTRCQLNGKLCTLRMAENNKGALISVDTLEK